MHLTANLPRNLPVKTFCKLVKIRQNYGHESAAPFFGPSCVNIRAVGSGDDPSRTDDTASAVVFVPCVVLETTLPRP